jgi:hypothetical protein
VETKIEVVTELQRMLKDMFSASEAGALPARLARAHGYVDGYMRALLVMNVVTRTELLNIVTTERRLFSERTRGNASMLPKRDETAAA